VAQRYLLDTNILSDLIRNPRCAIAQKIEARGEAAVCTSIIVACELRYGAAKKGSPVLSARVDELLEAIEVFPYEEDADRHYAAIRRGLTRDGNLIGPNDLLIAAHTLALDMTLVTANVSEFSRVPGLQVENWIL
jgi:tRNA(fMet)-specific endonuclease VapC